MPGSTTSTVGHRSSFSSSGSWLLLVTGGGPTEDKAGVVFTPPDDRDRVSHQLTLRVPDCHEAYAVLKARGA